MDMCKMLIRYLEKFDTERVSDIEKEVFSQPWTKSGFDEVVGRDDTLFLVAEDDGAIKGYIGAYLSLDEAEITNVCTAPECRKQGVAEALIDRFFEEAKIKEIDRIVLEVRISNEPAKRLYEKKGFISLGTRKGFYSFPTEDALIMERVL